MSRIVDPSTGRPVGDTRKQSITADQIIKALASHKDKLTDIDLQMFKMSLFIEYVTNALQEKLFMLQENLQSSGVNMELVIDMNKFPEWADARAEEMRQEAMKSLEINRAASAQGLEAELSGSSGISLEDK